MKKISEKRKERFREPDRQYWNEFVTALCVTLARTRLCIHCAQRATVSKRVACERRRILNSAYFLFQKERNRTHYSQPPRSLSCTHTHLVDFTVRTEKPLIGEKTSGLVKNSEEVISYKCLLNSA